MGLFSSIAGAGLNLLGSKLSQRSQERGAQAALSAGAPFSVKSRLGSTVFNAGTGRLDIRPNPNFNRGIQRAGQIGLRSLNDLQSLDFEGREMAELERLQTLRAPLFADARAGLQSRLFNQGRLGAARGGGLTDRLFNPETAGLEEAIARTQLGDIGAARQMSQDEQRFLLGQATGAFQLPGIIQAPLFDQARIGIAARTPQALAAMQAQPHLSQARTTEGFFGALGQGLGGLGDSLFGGGGGSNFVNLRSHEGRF